MNEQLLRPRYRGGIVACSNRLSRDSSEWPGFRGGLSVVNWGSLVVILGPDPGIQLFCCGYATPYLTELPTPPVLPAGQTVGVSWRV